MSTTNEQRRDLGDTEVDLTMLPIPQIVTELWIKRRTILIVSGIVMLLSVVVVLILPNEYTSTAQLMPQDSQTYSAVSTLSALSGNGPVIPGGGGGGLLTTRTPGQTSIGILKSRSVQDDLIKRFNLLSVYHYKLYSDARSELLSRTAMEEDKNTGIVRIDVEDHDPFRARDIAKAYVEDLNQLLNAENTSSAHLERIFLEDRLVSLKSDLDNTSRKLSEFSSHNATLNPAGQGQALIEAAAKLQGELITAQSQLYALKAQYSNDNVRVRSVQARVNELQSQLQKMGATETKDNGSSSNANEIYPTIRELPLLGATYYDLSRQLTMQQTIYEILTKQYELAKVQEAKELPAVRTLDQPDVPDKHSSPHRLIIVILSTLFSFIFSAIWISVRKFWQLAGESHPTKATVLSTMHSIREQTPHANG